MFVMQDLLGPDVPSTSGQLPRLGHSPQPPADVLGMPLPGRGVNAGLNPVLSLTGGPHTFQQHWQPSMMGSLGAGVVMPDEDHPLDTLGGEDIKFGKDEGQEVVGVHGVDTPEPEDFDTRNIQVRSVHVNDCELFVHSCLSCTTNQ